MTLYKAPTLDDVAKHAGVSSATVSRCLNNPSQLSQKTREKVEKSIQALQYTPNFGGQALAAQKTNTIGAIIPTMENAIFARGIQAFQQRLNEANITLLLAGSNYSPDQESIQIRTLVSRGAEGILLIGFERSEASFELLEKRKIPYVIAWQNDNQQDRLCVGFDNSRASYEMTSKVIDYGHKEIGYIAGITKGNDRARLRLEGAKKCVYDRLGIEDMPVTEAKYSIESGRNAFADLITRRPDITVIMCGNDVLAVGAIMEAKARGIKVPEELSVTGFDDIDLSEIISPALTTVHVPHRKMGRAAANMFIAMRDKSNNTFDALDSVQLNTEIIIRQSLKKLP